jgi:FkbM family methyltransferase
MPHGSSKTNELFTDAALQADAPRCRRSGPDRPAADAADRFAWLRSVRRMRRARTGSRLGKLARMPGRLLRTRFAHWVAPHEATAKLFFGERMRVFLPEPVSHHLYTYGMFEDDLTTILLEHLRPEATLIDVGAHFGYYTLLGLRLVGESGRVHAFEPTPATYDMLARNVGDRANVRLVRQAVFSRNGTLRFNDYGRVFSAFNGYTDPQTRIDPRNSRAYPPTIVACCTLDAYCDQNGVQPDFIKIDAESAEFDVLQGAENVLQASRPAIVVELSDLPDQPNGSRCIDYLTRLGYQALEYDTTGRMRVHPPRDEYHNTRLLFLSA